MTATEAQRSAATGREPPPAEVPGNRWTDLDVAELGSWSPTATVTVVVTGEDPHSLCPLTLASLSAQTYPGELTGVLVDEATGAGDDVLSWAGDELSARVGPAGEEPDGEVVVILEAGAIALPGLVEAHARWQHAACDAVSVGMDLRVDARALSAEHVAAAARAGGLEALLSPRASAGPTPVENFLERTRGLTERHPDGFWIASQGSVGVRRELLRSAGGRSASVLGRLGRLDLAWRLEAAGCLLVPERAAVTYEPYGRELLAPRLEPPLTPPGDAHDAARAETLVPAPGYRRNGSARRHKRPTLTVHVAAGEEPAEEVLEAVDGVLGGRFADLELRLSIPEGRPERRLLEESVASDPRIAVETQERDGRNAVAGHVHLPLVAQVDERTIEDLRELLLKEEVGALHVTVPGEVPRNAMVEVRGAGPLGRARRVAEHRGEDVDEVLGRLFGERWISGVEVSIRRRGAAEPQVTEHGPLSQATDLEHERTQHLRHRSRADNLEARADRLGQRAVDERLRAWRERRRAGDLEQALADAGEPPWYWGRLRLAARARGAVRRRR